MLTHSFSHIPGIGAATEAKIWQQGIHSMTDFLAAPPDFLSSNKIKTMTEHLLISQEKLAALDPHYFYDQLPTKEHWRLFKTFQQEAVYLYIETTGLSGDQDIITTIALYDGAAVKYYIHGENLDDFPTDILAYPLLITYNGKTFDIPFIENYFAIQLPQVHLDLRYILSSLGYQGGLKACEQQLGIGRTGGLASVDGFFAVLLWHDYQRYQRKTALETLLAYNIEDVLNLEYLMITAYNKKLENLPFTLAPLAIADPPANPFEIDIPTIQRLKSAYSPL